MYRPNVSREEFLTAPNFTPYDLLYDPNVNSLGDFLSFPFSPFFVFILRSISPVFIGDEI